MQAKADSSSQVVVQILRPRHVAGKLGVLMAKERIPSARASSRWLVKLVHEQVLLSLSSNEFQVVRE
ncbi:MAG: hypothetical protein HC921_12830 [Synechococcaceae cyanobacterium SM2_3_1]|nr:hypothetical protein [Synechococcaceae cyanobacterium SM2_3_1]